MSLPSAYSVAVAIVPTQVPAHRRRAAGRAIHLTQVAQHTKATLQSEFLDKEPNHKVKMIHFSPKHGAPTPLLRRIATDYTRDVSVARVLYKPSEASFWTKHFGLVCTNVPPIPRS